MTIRDTNIRYNKTESDVLSGDFVILYVESASAHICRFICRGLCQSYEDQGDEQNAGPVGGLDPQGVSV